MRDESGHVLGGREDRSELLIRTNGVGGTSFMPDGTAVFSSQDIHDNLFLFDDLHELPAHEKSPSGLEGNRVRWSDGWRALDPSVSPDGRRVVFTTNHRGTTYLMMADVVASSVKAGAHQLTNVRRLVTGQPFDQAYTPRWSPDNRHVAYSSWERGGYRDIRIVDTSDDSVFSVTHDRSIDGDPSYSADGRWLFFHSDRTGIMNVYAYELATGRLRQVTNVVNGAYQPEPSPDGRSLAYVGYTHQGYDMFVMPLDESRWLDPLPYQETRPAPPAQPPPASFTPKPYNPWLTLAPRAFKAQLEPGNFGQAAVVSAVGSDIAGFHNFSVSETTEFEHPDLEGSISYTYSRLPFDVSASAFRDIAPATNLNYGGQNQEWIKQETGFSSAISYPIPRAFDSQSVEIGYSIASINGAPSVPASALSPWDPPSIPSAGMLGAMHVGWSYSNAQGYLWSVGNERGFDASASFDVTDPVLASDYSGYASRLGLGSLLPHAVAAAPRARDARERRPGRRQLGRQGAVLRRRLPAAGSVRHRAGHHPADTVRAGRHPAARLPGRGRGG